MKARPATATARESRQRGSAIASVAGLARAGGSVRPSGTPQSRSRAMRNRRLIDAFDLHFTQDDVPFAIPHLEEDIPLYLDPFLLWSSASTSYRELHEQLVGFLDHFRRLVLAGRTLDAERLLLTCNEPQDLGLGYSQGSKSGSFIGPATAANAAQLFLDTPQLHDERLEHVEELGLFVPKIAEDRISDLTACVLREFLVRYTGEQAAAFEIPTLQFRIPEIWDSDALEWRTGLQARLPYHPDRQSPLLLAPLDLLRHLPWINYPDYYRSHYARHVLPAKSRQRQVPKSDVLAHNRANYAQVKLYVAQKERTASLATPDPLFEPLKISTLDRKVKSLDKLPTGAGEPAKVYEELVFDVLSSALYPELEYADSQVRTDSGAHIRDLLFYNDGKIEFTQMLREHYGSQQLVFELKNVRLLEPEHVNQLYRYLDGDFGHVGVLVSRKEPPRAVRRNIVDLWSAKRTAIVCLTDEDLRLMIQLLEARRRPIEAVKKKYVEFIRTLPK